MDNNPIIHQLPFWVFLNAIFVKQTLVLLYNYTNGIFLADSSPAWEIASPVSNTTEACPANILACPTYVFGGEEAIFMIYVFLLQ